MGVSGRLAAERRRPDVAAWEAHEYCEAVSRETRSSDSPFVESITRVSYEARTRELSTPDGTWDIVVMVRGDRTIVLQTGVLSRPVVLENEPGDSYLAISFRPGVFVPTTPGSQMVDRGLERPLVGARKFAMENETLEVPTFENAEGLVARLARAGLLARDELVESVVAGHPRAIHPRSMQRHFLQALGVTPKYFEQIQRARRAVELLQQGVVPAEVAITVGYSDQPHLTRSLKTIMGSTPGALVRQR